MCISMGTSSMLTAKRKMRAWDKLSASVSPNINIMSSSWYMIIMFKSFRWKEHLWRISHTNTHTTHTRTRIRTSTCKHMHTYNVAKSIVLVLLLFLMLILNLLPPWGNKSGTQWWLEYTKCCIILFSLYFIISNFLMSLVPYSSPTKLFSAMVRSHCVFTLHNFLVWGFKNSVLPSI